MSQVIFKYPILNLGHGAENTIFMGRNARILTVQMQRMSAFIWALDSDSESLLRKFRIFGTGHSIETPAGKRLNYIGTVQDGPFVWHVFEEVDF